MPTSSPDGNHYVFLDLSSRSKFGDDADTSTMQDFQTNRIALKCDSVSISTAKKNKLYISNSVMVIYLLAQLTHWMPLRHIRIAKVVGLVLI